MKREFNDIISSLKDSIATYTWYVDFAKVYKNIKKIELNLNIVNYLIGKEDFDSEFLYLLKEYPDVVTVFPILLAVRSNCIRVIDGELIEYKFIANLHTPEEYLNFVKQTGLKDLFVYKKIKNVVDYVTGVEVGLDSNARKNRTGKVMEDIVEGFITKVDNIEYLNQATKKDIALRFNTNVLDNLILNEEDGKTNKRFDFAVKTISGHIFLIETNFYSGGGSKLNETARSYAQLAENIKHVENVSFIWITDGRGWNSAKNNLYEAYQHIDHLYSILDLENNILNKIF